MQDSISCLQALAYFEQWQRAEQQEEHFAAWQAHVAGCEHCQSDGLNQPELLRQVWDSLLGLDVPLLGADFEQKLMQRLENENSRKQQHKLFWQRVDVAFDWMHIPVVAVVLSLFVWFKTAEPQQANYLENREKNLQKIDQLMQKPLNEVLDSVQKIYPQRMAPRRQLEQESFERNNLG